MCAVDAAGAAGAAAACVSLYGGKVMMVSVSSITALGYCCVILQCYKNRLDLDGTQAIFLITISLGCVSIYFKQIYLWELYLVECRRTLKQDEKRHEAKSERERERLAFFTVTLEEKSQ